MSKPITNIVIPLPSQDALKDVWKLFDYIIAKMEEPGRDGIPKVDVQGRKRFRVEVMKAPEDKLLEVFSRWVTLLVPEMVPATPSLIQRVVVQEGVSDTDATKQADSIIAQEEEQRKEEERKEKIRQDRVERLRKAREVKESMRGDSGTVRKSHHKKKVG
ncbi:MAG: hypothetical protein WC291_11405 [Thermodesulfovibrionales bacterium]|jgi:hypothetical protein